MSVSAEYLDFVTELLQPLGAIRTRRMFGGAGIYCDGVFFAIVVDDVLYLKADDQNRGDFEAAGLEPFVYLASGKPMRMSYYRAPDEAMDSAEQMRPWARGAVAAALRAPQKKSRPKSKHADA